MNSTSEREKHGGSTKVEFYNEINILNNFELGAVQSEDLQTFGPEVLWFEGKSFKKMTKFNLDTE